ncbi:MAG: response regulator [Candidatus Cloacimonetes bacterium]|nr:response regulator [Candidatus Cloacimonadota bacterium]
MLKKILIVDDEKQINNILSRYLRKNYQVSISENGLQALSLLKKETFNLIIMDVIMPEKEGIETLIEIKNTYPNIKIIMMSGGGKIGPQSYLKIAKAVGADEVIEKPFELSDLHNIIKKLLDNAVE